jgi:hypothetical protein
MSGAIALLKPSNLRSSSVPRFLGVRTVLTLEFVYNVNLFDGQSSRFRALGSMMIAFKSLG